MPLGTQARPTEGGRSDTSQKCTFNWGFGVIVYLFFLGILLFLFRLAWLKLSGFETNLIVFYARLNMNSAACGMSRRTLDIPLSFFIIFLIGI